MKKKLLSFLLAVITVLNLFPFQLLSIAEEDLGIAVEDMEVGKLYKATFKTKAQTGWDDIYVYSDASFGKSYDSTIWKDTLPQDLVVQLMSAGDMCVYVTNEEWKGRTFPGNPIVDLNDYRYVDANELIILEKIEEEPEKPQEVLGVTFDGKPVEEIELFEDGKMPLQAAVPENVTEEVKWSWEVLVDPATDLWVAIGDKASAVCEVSYALVVNVLDENGETKVRATARGEDTEYVSKPITVKMKRAPKPMDTVFENPVSESLNVENLSAASYSRSNSNNVMLLSTSTEQVTITVKFIKVRPDGTQAEAAYPDIRTLKTDYEAYTVTLPSVLGYYPSMVEPSNPYDFSKNPPQDSTLTTVDIPAGKTADDTINVYYYPKEEKYTIYHYFQNINNDQYDDVPPTIEEKKSTVGAPVPDCHMAKTSYQHLYYEHTEVATDGSTIIEIYYDREYFTVLFDLEKKGAYGPENLYVKYETEVGLRDPQCPGWEFSSWKQAVVDDNGDITGYKTTEYYAGKTNLHIVTEAVIFRAVWEGVATTYSVVYWLENPDDGNYSVWHTEDNLTATSGGFKKWNGVVPERITNDQDYKFVTLNTTKTEEDWDDKTQGVLIEGDGSSTVDVYFKRRMYDISFLATPDTSLIHNHTTDPCKYNPMYCTHVHKEDCTVSTHIHTSSCSLGNCSVTEHMHGDDCCDTHVHQLSCYSGKAENFTDTFSTILLEKVKDQARANGDYLALISAEWTVTTAVKNASAKMGERVAAKAPPKNLQNGYVQVLNGETETITWDGWLKSYSVTTTFDVPAIYIDGDWYYYSGSLPDGSVETVTTSACQKDNHDHTSGCTYGTKCTKTEHVHNDNCYTCGLANGTCPHQHTADCYGNVCMVPSYESYTDTNANINGYYTVLRLQAKYGQDITEYLPYYLELYEYNLHKEGDDNFVGWKYAGTGWADTGETRYVKHVTMVEELCYSNGVTAVAQYESAANAYLLYYLFESFDQSSDAIDYSINGEGRQQYNGKWYDSDSVHMQLVMWPSADGTIADGKKEILGMDYAGTSTGTLNFSIGTTITSETLNAFYYDRSSENKVIFHNGGETILTIPTEGQSNPLKFGLNLGDLATALKNSAEYGYFDVNTVPYPSNLEANAYVFDGWYTTPYQNEYTKVDWDTSTIPDGELNLYAHWKPVTRYVHVYEDASFSVPFDTDNKGYQEVGHRSYAIAPDYKLSNYYKQGYKFNGWFYKDPVTDEEKAFLFNFPVTQDMKIYAKWTLDVLVPYEVYYKVESPKGSGNYVDVANPIKDSSVAGQNKTFRAATGTALYSEYNEGFFPLIGSHTLQMMYNLDGEGNVIPNVYTFIYEEVEEISYFVQFIDNETGEVFDHTDEKYPKTVEHKTRKAAVTELFVPIEGYTVDKYSKSLIISATDPEVNNVITFYYDKNEEDEPITAPWVVNHLIQNADGTYSVYKQESDVGEVLADNSDIYFGTVLTDITKYTFIKAEVKTRQLNKETSLVEDVIVGMDGLISVSQNGETRYGYELNEYGMEINLYYDRDNVGYKVEYKASDSGEIFYSYEVPADESLPHGDSVTATLDQQKHMEIVLNKGYQLVDDTQTSISLTLYIDESRNVITFLYEKFDATFEYQVICDDLTNGAGLDFSRDIIAAGSAETPHGATPIESETYYFAGWFADEACTKPITAETIESEKYSVILDEYNHLVPTKTQFTYTDPDDPSKEYTGNIYLSATYYALFLPRSADLEVTVTSGKQDTFILTFTGVAGTFAEGTEVTVAVSDGVKIIITDMPIGEYTVTSDKTWSWKYDQINASVTVKVKEGGELKLNVSPSNDQWLTGDSMGTYGSTGN